eukprot:2613028-Rhodomonas_salina.1
MLLPVPVAEPELGREAHGPASGCSSSWLAAAAGARRLSLPPAASTAVSLSTSASKGGQREGGVREREAGSRERERRERGGSWGPPSDSESEDGGDATSTWGCTLAATCRPTCAVLRPEVAHVGCCTGMRRALSSRASQLFKFPPPPCTRRAWASP